MGLGWGRGQEEIVRRGGGQNGVCGGQGLVGGLEERIGTGRGRGGEERIDVWRRELIGPPHASGFVVFVVRRRKHLIIIPNQQWSTVLADALVVNTQRVVRVHDRLNGVRRTARAAASAGRNGLSTVRARGEPRLRLRLRGVWWVLILTFF